ncbi:MAG: hypothetical protein JNM56_22255 [Planctomycetia bacterium]|nr:hypothetical protein [Planctomycetia bacterium]
MPTITECPSCRRKLRLPDHLTGQAVRCPTCATAFPAQPLAEESREPEPAAAAAVPAALVQSPGGLPEMNLDDLRGPVDLPAPPRPLRAVLVDSQGSDGRPRTCPHCANPLAAAATLCPACGEDVDAATPDWDRKGAVRRDCEPHRGGLILTLGVIGLVGSLIHIFAIVGLPLSIAAWVMGQGDLKLMAARQMDPQGMSNTQAGKVCGIIGTVFGCLWALLLGLFLVAVVLG